MTQPQAGETAARVSHHAYVEQVVAALAELEIAVRDLQVESTPVRRATMWVTVPVGTPWTDATIRLRWTERVGWAYDVAYADESSGPRPPIRHGFRPVPEPKAVAGWMHIALAHPEATPDQDSGQFTPQEVDAQLRRYTAAG